MSKNNESINNSLFDLLRSRGYSPTMLGTDGKEVPVAEEAEVFQFTFTKDGEEYGPVTVTVDGKNKVIVYFGDNVANSPSDTSGDISWYTLLNYLKRFSHQHQLSFELKNTDHLKYDMAKRTHMKKVDEGYYATGKKSSYSDSVPQVKIVLQHNRALEEGERRYRAIEKIFIENAQGERFAIPTNKPGLARVYARHIAEGGTPYDDAGKHINSLCEEYAKMSGFVRAVRSKQFNESTMSLVNEGVNHYQKLRETLGKMSGHRGYHAYFEGWAPTLTEDEDTTDLSEMFASTELDPRIESVMPILRKLHKTVSEMTEVSSLSEWADDIIGESFDEVEETAYGQAQAGEQQWQGNPKAVSTSLPGNKPWTLVLNGKVLGTDKNVSVLRALQQKRGGKIVRQGEVAEAAKWRDHPDALEYDDDEKPIPKGSKKNDLLQRPMGDIKNGKITPDSAKDQKQRLKYNIGKHGKSPVPEEAKWRQGYSASGHPPGFKHKSGEVGPIGGTFTNEPSGYDGETSKVPVQKHRDQPDQLADRGQTKISAKGTPLTAKNAQRNLKGAIGQSKGKHGPVGALPESEINELDKKTLGSYAKKANYERSYTSDDDKADRRGTGVMKALDKIKGGVNKGNSLKGDAADARWSAKHGNTGPGLNAKKSQSRFEKNVDKATGVEEGRFVKGPGGVPLDRQGNPVAPKAAKVSAPRAPAPKKLTLDDVWRKVEEVVGQIYPDGDPIDWMMPWFKRQGIEDFKVGEIIDRAARKNGYKDMYDYWKSFGEDTGYNEQSIEENSNYDWAAEKEKIRAMTTTQRREHALARLASTKDVKFAHIASKAGAGHSEIMNVIKGSRGVAEAAPKAPPALAPSFTQYVFKKAPRGTFTDLSQVEDLFDYAYLDDLGYDNMLGEMEDTGETAKKVVLPRLSWVLKNMANRKYLPLVKPLASEWMKLIVAKLDSDASMFEDANPQGIPETCNEGDDQLAGIKRLLK